MPGLSVVRDTYSNGRVDLTIKSESVNNTERCLAEVKIYSGSSYHMQAIGRLTSCYSTGLKAATMFLNM